ncbi:hypothetical protein ISS85_02265 [Candidatus Microgenomates bacterium]|nr:hypothetical protein [Candidatus Microgenomates bacterium]
MLLRVQDRILLSLAFLEDLFEDVAGAGGLAGFSYKQIYGFVPKKYRKSNFMASVNYALKTEKIEKIIKKGQPYLKLTGQGKKKLVRQFSLVQLQKKRWDGLWRMLPYDIKETSRNDRNKLRNKLCELGFKQFQKSIYLSPYPIEQEMSDFLKTLKLEGKAYLLLCQTILGIKNRELANKLWKLDRLNRKYKKLFKKLEVFSDKNNLKKIKADYLQLLSEDPFFPKELLPKLWWEEKVRQELKRILRKK